MEDIFVNILEELILLKCPYYTMWSTDSMQSFSTSQYFYRILYILIILKFMWNN